MSLTLLAGSVLVAAWLYAKTFKACAGGLSLWAQGERQQGVCLLVAHSPLPLIDHSLS